MRGKISSKIEVVFFQRKPRSVGNYSVEYIFEDVRNRLQDKVHSRTVISNFESRGVWNRVRNGVQAWRLKGQINHITGDVNYLGIFLSPKNTINTILDCVHLNSSSGIRYWIYKKFWLEIPEKRARFLTAISESTKREIIKHHRCDSDKIRVIPVAISPDFRYKYKPFNKVRPVLLQVGTAPNKNIPKLIEALVGLPCVLHIVGKRNREYEMLAKESGVEYIYESGLSNAEIIKRYEEADIVTLVSTYEGFGMPILEAQAVGRPVISSNVYSMPEVAGESALLVDPDNAGEIRAGISRLIEDDAFREDKVRLGLENVKRFDAEKIAMMYYALYKEVSADLVK
jgi:glycosyltransferase involved in cell wall biosynthesis